jgi:DNA primase
MNRTIVEEIKARIPIEELISSYVKIDKSGRSYKARCPFHNEKTASFFISPERGGYYCFGCAAKGDIFSFVEQFEGLDFKGALKVLAEKAGVKLVVDQKNDSERDQYFKITEQVAVYFEDQYKKSKPVQDYIKSRGINPESRESFRIGWAPEGWQNLLNYLKTKGWSEGIIEKAGFIKKREDSTDGSVKSSDKNISGYYDRFRGRIMFPITDSSGRVVAFTGRILKDDGQSAKYLNSPETPIFIKSQILFGLDKAKSEIRRLNYSILVEGQMDLILSHQVGVKNTIAASGTALTDQAQNDSGVVSNLGMVRRLSPNMIIALDSDKAGKTATMRAVAATALSMGMSVKIADASAEGFVGKDPADLILQNPENWKTVLKNARHVIEFELGNIMNEIKDPHRLGRVIKDRIFPFLSKMDSEMDKAFYMKMISEKAGLNEQAVWDDLRKFEKTVKVENSAKNISSSNNQQNKSFGSNQPVLKNNLTGSTGSNENLPKADKSSRIDMVQRRMFGLLSLIEKTDNAQADKYRDKIKTIADNNYKNIIEKIEPHLSDMVFEAESFYGDDKNRFHVHMSELLMNFELDIINEELIQTMTKLRQAEKVGDANVVAEMAKKCQELSVRKAKVGKI